MSIYKTLVEMVEDRVMFDLADLAYVQELHDYENGPNAKREYRTRVMLRSGQPILLEAPYEDVRSQLTIAMRAVNQ